MTMECLPQDWANTFCLPPRPRPVPINRHGGHIVPATKSTPGFQPIFPKGCRPKGVIYRPILVRPPAYPPLTACGKQPPVNCLPGGQTFFRINTPALPFMNQPQNLPNQQPPFIPLTWPRHAACISDVWNSMPNHHSNLPVPIRPAVAVPETGNFIKPWHTPREYKPESTSKPLKIVENMDKEDRIYPQPSGVAPGSNINMSEKEEFDASAEIACATPTKGSDDRHPINQPPESPDPHAVDPDRFAAGLGLIAVKVIPKSTVWLNVTLQVDTSGEIKRGQQGVQYRSLITNIVTELFYPPQLCPPDDVVEDEITATASYDERGRLTVLQVEFITPGIYKVDTDSDTGKRKPLGKPSTRSVTLTRMDSLESLVPKSQYFILGDLCPVPRTFQKCHRNAQTLYKKLMEYMYSREFRKYTLPLLLENGEEDVWSVALKAPRTRSRAADHAESNSNRVFIKRRTSSPNHCQKQDTKDLRPAPKRKRRNVDSSSVSGDSLSPISSTSASPPQNSDSLSPDCPPCNSLPLYENANRLSHPSYPSSNQNSELAESKHLLQMPVPPTCPKAQICPNPVQNNHMSKESQISANKSGLQPSHESLACRSSIPQRPDTLPLEGTSMRSYQATPNSISPVSTCSTAASTPESTCSFPNSTGHSSDSSSSVSNSPSSRSPLSLGPEFTSSTTSVAGYSTISLIDCETLGLSQNSDHLSSDGSSPAGSEFLHQNSGCSSPLHHSPSYTSSFLEPLNLPELSFGDELLLDLPLDLSQTNDCVPLDLSVSNSNQYSM